MLLSDTWSTVLITEFQSILTDTQMFHTVYSRLKIPLAKRPFKYECQTNNSHSQPHGILVSIIKLRQLQHLCKA